MNLSPDQKERYQRNILLKDIDEVGQIKLLKSKVLIVGAGGLGSPVSLYLAAAGVGTLGLVDADRVDMSNLQRQIIHFTSDIGQPKVLSAQNKLNKLNPDVNIIPFETLFSEENANDIINGFDFVVDATDNFKTKFLINDVCVKLGKPFSHGGVLRYDAQTMTFLPGHTCYRCVFAELPDEETARRCSRDGVLGPVPGMLGSIQAMEVIKYLSGVGDLLINQLLTVNLATLVFRKIELKQNPLCKVCAVRN